VRTEGLKGALLSTLLLASLMSLLLIPAEAAWGQDIEWIRQFGTYESEFAMDVVVDASGNVYVTGTTYGALPGQASSGFDDAFVRKYDGAGNEIWTRQFGSSQYDYAVGVAVDASGSVYVAGYTAHGTLPGQESSGYYDAFIRKYDGAGNEIWTRQFGSSWYDYAYGVAVDASGSVYVAGDTTGTLPGQASSGYFDAFVRKYDGAGNEIWTRQFGSSEYDYAQGGVAVDSSGNVYVAGWTSGALPGQVSSGWGDAFVRKYDGSGDEIWTRQFGSSDGDYTKGMAVDTLGNVYVAGYTGGTFPGQTSSGNIDAFIRKYDGAGNEIWTRQFGSSWEDHAEGVAVDASGSVYVAGLTYGALPGQVSSGGSYDAFVRKYDGSGNEIWTRQFGSSIYTTAYDAAVDGSGSIYVAGSTWGALLGQTHSGGYDVFLVKFVQVNTPTGTNVQVTPAPGVSVTFSTVTVGGNTSATTNTSGPPPPSGYRIVGVAGQPIYYDIITTATYSGPITICIDYDETQVVGNEADLKLWKNDTGWQDITTSVDTVNNKIYGSTTTLSIFIVAGPTPPAAVGGIVIPPDKLALIAPWIILAALIAIGTVSVAVYWKRYRT